MFNMTSNSSAINVTELIALNSTNHNSTSNSTSLVTTTSPPAVIPPPSNSHFRTQATIIIQVTLLTILGLVIVLGNLASIVTFLKNQSLRRRCHYLVISLSFADLLVGVNTFMTMYFFLTGPQFNLFIVSLEFIDSFTGCTSILTLAVIATERFYAIYFPFRHRMLRFKFYMACVSFPWLASGGVAALFLISHFGANNDVYVAYTYSIFLLILSALIVVVVCYMVIGCKMRQNNPSAQNQNRAERERKLAVTLLIVTLASLLTWLPHQCFMTVLYFCKVCTVPHFNIFYIMKFLQFLNSGINVFIYIVRMPEFRQAFLAMLCNREQTNPQESTKISSVSSVRQSAYQTGNKDKGSLQKNQDHRETKPGMTLNSRLNVNKAECYIHKNSTKADANDNTTPATNDDKADCYVEKNSANEKPNDNAIPTANDNPNDHLSVNQDTLKKGVKNVGFSPDIDDTKL